MNKFSDFLENVKTKMSLLITNFFDFYEENKKNSILILSLIFVIMIFLIILISVNSSKKKNQKEQKNVFELTQDLQIPKGPEIPNDYIFSRQTKEKWSEEEANQWFTIPTQNKIDLLDKANDKMINEILGAAP